MLENKILVLTKFLVSDPPKCTGLPVTWEHVTTVEKFPVEQDTEIKLECEAGYTLQGSNTVTCKQDRQYTFSLEPVCLESKCLRQMGKYHTD